MPSAAESEPDRPSSLGNKPGPSVDWTPTRVAAGRLVFTTARGTVSTFVAAADDAGPAPQGAG